MGFARGDDGAGLRGEAVVDAVDQGGVVDQGERGHVVGQVDDLDVAAGDGLDVAFGEGAVQEAFGDHLQHRGEAARGQRGGTVQREGEELGARRIVGDRVADVVDHRQMLSGDLPAFQRVHPGREPGAEIGRFRHQPCHGPLRHPGGGGQVRDQRPAVKLGAPALLRCRVSGPRDGGCGIRHQPDLRRLHRRPRPPPRLEPGDQPHTPATSAGNSSSPEAPEGERGGGRHQDSQTERNRKRRFRRLSAAHPVRNPRGSAAPVSPPRSLGASLPLSNL